MVAATHDASTAEIDNHQLRKLVQAALWTQLKKLALPILLVASIGLVAQGSTDCSADSDLTRNNGCGSSYISYAIAVGVVSTVLTLGLAAASECFPAAVDANPQAHRAAACFLVLWWACGAAVLTWQTEVPTYSVVGNAYFCAWFGFLSSAALCYVVVLQGGGSSSSSSSSSSSAADTHHKSSGSAPAPSPTARPFSAAVTVTATATAMPPFTIAALAVASLVQMISAAVVCGGPSDTLAAAASGSSTAHCSGAAGWVVACGAVSFAACTGVCVWSVLLPATPPATTATTATTVVMMKQVAAAVLVAWWAAGVYVGTFGTGSAARRAPLFVLPGNGYFASWVALGLAACIAMRTFQQQQQPEQEQEREREQPLQLQQPKKTKTSEPPIVERV